MGRGDLPDAEWELIGPLLPPKRGRWARPAGTIGSFSLACSTCCGLPAHGVTCTSDTAKWNSVYVRFRSWAERGVWEGIFAQLAGVDGVPAKLIIDDNCNKVHRIVGRVAVPRLPRRRGHRSSTL